MTYQQAGRNRHFETHSRMGGFIPALLSTLISVLGFIYQHSVKSKGINAVMLDFVHVMVDMVRFNTPFLNLFGTTRRCLTWIKACSAALI